MEYRKLADLVKLDRNPRTITESDMEKLKASLSKNKDYFEARPIILSNRTGKLVIIAGNQRYEAAKALGIEEVPTFLIEGLTEGREREIIIRDNVSNGEWDYDILANEFDLEDLDQWGLDIPDDIKINASTGDAQEDDFEIPGESEIKTDIKPGDVIEIGPHRLICGDCTKGDTLAKLFDGAKASLVVTDPPYNVAYVGKTKDALTIKNDQMGDGAFYQFLLDFYRALIPFCTPGTAWYVWHADSEGANFRGAMAAAGIPVRQCLIWVKNSMVLGRQDHQWKHEPCLYGYLPGPGVEIQGSEAAMEMLQAEMERVRDAMAAKGHDLNALLTTIREANDGPDYISAHDPCLYGWQEGAAHRWYNNRSQTTLLEFDRPSRSSDHPTMKPIPLIGYQIGNSSRPGDIVADVFGGSGTTMVACHQTGRIAYLAELDPKYCQVIVDRMRKLEPGITIKKNGVTWTA